MVDRMVTLAAMVMDVTMNALSYTTASPMIP